MDDNYRGFEIIQVTQIMTGVKRYIVRKYGTKPFEKGHTPGAFIRKRYSTVADAKRAISRHVNSR